jgi:hypothetical protein
MTKSTVSFEQWDFSQISTIHVFILASSRILMIHPTLHLPFLSSLAYMLMILCSSLPSKEQEAKLCRILADQIPVNFMGTVEWFLGIHFNWNVSDNEVEVHLNQSGFARKLVERFECETRDPTPTATPWRSGLPIDSIPAASIDDVSPAQHGSMKVDHVLVIDPRGHRLTSLIGRASATRIRPI